MFPKGLFINLILIAISIGIFLTYLRPTFTVIEADQNAIGQYEQEIIKVETLTTRLSQLANEAEQLSAEDRERLLVYLPNEVDVVSVQRDLFLIAQAVGVQLQGLSGAEQADTDLATTETDDGTTTNNSQLVPYQFEIEFSATYNRLKQFLAALEQNHYPLEVVALEITEGGEGEDTATGELGVVIRVRTYGLQMLKTIN